MSAKKKVESNWCRISDHMVCLILNRMRPPMKRNNTRIPWVLWFWSNFLSPFTGTMIFTHCYCVFNKLIFRIRWTQIQIPFVVVKMWVNTNRGKFSWEQYFMMLLPTGITRLGRSVYVTVIYYAPFHQPINTKWQNFIPFCQLPTNVIILASQHLFDTAYGGVHSLAPLSTVNNQKTFTSVTFPLA
jgi:hypothetical protein